MTKFNLVITGPETAMGETIMQAQKLGCTVSDISMLTKAVEAAPVEVAVRTRQKRRNITKAAYDALGNIKRVNPTSQDLTDAMNKDGFACDRNCVSSALSRLSAMGLVDSPDAPRAQNKRWRIKEIVDQKGYDDAARQYSQFYSPKQECASNRQPQLSLQ